MSLRQKHHLNQSLKLRRTLMPGGKDGHSYIDMRAQIDSAAREGTPNLKQPEIEIEKERHNIEEEENAAKITER